MRRSALICTIFVALAAGLAVAGCTSAGTSNPAASANSVVTDDPSAGGSSTMESASPTPDEPGSSGGGASPASGGSGDSGGQSSPKPAVTVANTSGPAIVYFRVRQKPSCPAGTSVNPIAGTPVVLEWKVTRADKVTLSVDGPGVYGDGYAPTGTETLSFPCSGSEGDIQRHTYLLTVTNADGKQSKKLAVTATVHEVKQV